MRENFEGFTEEQVRKAILAREAQAKVAHPTDEKFKSMVSSKGVDTVTFPLKLSFMPEKALDLIFPM